MSESTLEKPLRLGLVDMGSNAIRVQIVEAWGAGREPRVLENHRASVRLGDEVFLTGTIPATTIDAAVEVMRRFRESCDRHGVDYISAIATSATREASNQAELLARIRVALRNRARRDAGDDERVFEVGELRVDLANRRVFLAGEAVALTPIEYRLLVTLVRHAGKVLTHRFLLREVWGPRHSDDSRYVRVFVANLRRKIEPDPSRPRYLLTEQGVGYRLVDE